MSDERARWDAYLWEPGGWVLRNKWGIRDQLTLDLAEHGETKRREREIARGKGEIPRTYDGAHLRAIHAHLFGNVYEWAGEYRTVGTEKGKSAFAPPEHIGRYVGYARRVIEETVWASLEPETWNMASRLSGPADPFGEPDPRPLESVFRTATQELSVSPAKAFGLDAETLRALWARGRGR